MLIQTYLNKVIKNKSQRVSKVEFEQAGLFYFTPKSKAIEFKASEEVSVLRPEFSWKAELKKFFIPIAVNDCLMNGVGSIKAKLFSVIPVTNLSNGEMLRGQMLRYLAEIPWFPHAFLLQPEIIFSPVDDKHIKATLTIKNVTATVLYEFNQEGLITSVSSKERSMIVRNEVINYPWGGFFSNYQEYDGVLIPTHAEVYWDLPEKRFTYFFSDIKNYKLVK